jgi:hypothetical protein
MKRGKASKEMQPRNAQGMIVKKDESGATSLVPGDGTLSRADRGRIFGTVVSHKGKSNTSFAHKRGKK